MPSSASASIISCKGRSSSASIKRLSSKTNAALPLSKRPYLVSLVKASVEGLLNWEYQRVIIYDYRKPINKASSRVALLTTLESYIKASFLNRPGPLLYESNEKVPREQKEWLAREPNERARVVDRFNKWNYVDVEELAELKSGLVGNERHFLNRIGKSFTLYFEPLAQWVNRLRRLRRLLFPGDKPWQGREDPELYARVRRILRDAQRDPKVM
ncbi:Serine/threonine-protein kinase Sgk2 [Tolypocladium paradoxum]|uniref:Serine/threonine-protein kinase Sgk2 n=1 Tax=Tolypocladium paradoxum TaxID=94208 RepID=A0A2S4KW13_9HYPO|nr:Serine/threonine-protein kinase Sgk2 [Tolypocladium paradoxum]